MGLVCNDDYANGTIKAHENTIPEKEMDTALLCETLAARVGPVCFTCYDMECIDIYAEKVIKDERGNLFSVEMDDGTEQSVWKMDQDIEKDVLAYFEECAPMRVLPMDITKLSARIKWETNRDGGRR